jgi:hypothetical protein
MPGDKHTEKIFDATACLALERFTASMESMLIPRTQRWYGLRSQRYCSSKARGMNSGTGRYTFPRCALPRTRTAS